jgi:hypothetical protein
LVKSSNASSSLPVYAKDLVLHFSRRCNRFVDSLRLSAEIGIKGAKNDSCVVFGPMLMKPEKVAGRDVLRGLILANLRLNFRCENARMPRRLPGPLP